jgi:antitoxin component of MazEF toxin-antitoxin module
LTPTRRLRPAQPLNLLSLRDRGQQVVPATRDEKILARDLTCPRDILGYPTSVPISEEISQQIMRDIVKVRKVGETLVVTLTQSILSEVDLVEGDRVVIEPVPPKRIIITKEEKTVVNTQRACLEIDVLEQKKRAMESEIEFVIAQNNLNIPVEPAMDQSDIVELRLKQLVWDRDKIDVQLAEKKLEMFDLQGTSTETAAKLTVTGEVIRAIGKDLGLRVDEADVMRQFWADHKIGTKLDWFDAGAPVISIGRKQDISRCKPGDRATITLVVEDRKEGKRGTRTVSFDILPTA